MGWWAGSSRERGRDSVPGGEGKGTFPTAPTKLPHGTVHSQANSPHSSAVPYLPFPDVRLLSADMQNNANEPIKMLIMLKELTAH